MIEYSTYCMLFSDFCLCMEIKKKVLMEIEGSGASKDILTAKVKEVFHIEDFILQTWDREFEEWIDVEDGDVVENNAKLMISSVWMKAWHHMRLR